MDVKHAVRSILPFSKGKVSETKLRDSIQGDGTTSPDRDPNGQQQSEGDQSRRDLSEDEIKEAIAILESFPGVKENGLKFKLVRNAEGVPVVHVEDRLGKIVRRIAEAELSQVKARQAEKKTTGNLLNKAM